MKNIVILLICFLILSCKSNLKLIGEYQANTSDSTHYIFNFVTKKYTHKWPNGTFSKGKFKILDLSSEKKLLVCNELVLKRSGGLEKEASSSGDSITIGAYIGYKNLGVTVFEICSKEKHLLYRKTFTNELQKTESEGILIKQ